jgi:outer membrane protein insertion porin family
MELRYPITLKASASIYSLLRQVHRWISKLQSIALSRSAGVGLRVFMPAFGLLGIDFGHGFDALPGQAKANGWETHLLLDNNSKKLIINTVMRKQFLYLFYR